MTISRTRIIVLIIIIAAVGFFFYSSNTNTDTPDIAEELRGKNELVIPSQPAGDSVVIARLIVQHAAWVVIYTDDAGKPGAVVGMQRFDTGIHANTQVPLLTSPLPFGRYYGILRYDNDDRQFDPAQDLPATTDTGDIIVAGFEIN